MMMMMMIMGMLSKYFNSMLGIQRVCDIHCKQQTRVE